MPTPMPTPIPALAPGLKLLVVTAEAEAEGGPTILN